MATSANLYISMMDVDLVTGAFRSILALHSPGDDDTCVECLGEYPCATVRIIASFQDAAVERVANPNPSATGSSLGEEEDNRRETHKFLYPECPHFSGGICHEHRGQVQGMAS